MRNTITPFLSYNSIGHVIYEMSSGHVLSGVVPTEEEYERVEYDEVKELLHFIFNLVVPPPRVRGWRGKVITYFMGLTPPKMLKKVSIIIFHCMFDMILYSYLSSYYRSKNTSSLKELFR